MTATALSTWALIIFAAGVACGVVGVQLQDNHLWRRGLRDDAANEAKLAEGRAAQVAGFKVHDFDARTAELTEATQ